jgi:hypothetical protein
MKKADQTSSELAFFKEKLYVIGVIEQVVKEKANDNAGLSFYDDAIHKVLVVLDKYQEQPQLLGPHVVDLINPINVGLLAYLDGMDKASWWLSVFLICNYRFLLFRIL